MKTRRSRRNSAIASSGPTAEAPSDANPSPDDPGAAHVAARAAARDAMPVAEPVAIERVQRWRFEKAIAPERPLPLFVSVPKKRLPGKDPREGQRMLLQWLLAATGHQRPFRIRAAGSVLEVGVLRATEPGGREPVLVDDAEGLALVERALKALHDNEAPPAFHHPPPPRMRRIDRDGNPIEETASEAASAADGESAADGPALPPLAPSPAASATEGEPDEAPQGPSNPA